MLVGFDTVSIGEPSARLADPSSGPCHDRSGVGSFSDRVWGVFRDRYHLAGYERRGWTLVELIEDAGFSAKSLNRPGIVHALDLLTRGEAGVLVVAKLDRASRSVMDAADLLARSRREGWKLVSLDLGLDPRTSTGELVATIMAAFAQWERRAIGVRTREALAAKQVQGVRLGRPAVLSTEIIARIVAAHQAGAGWSSLARQLNAEGVSTAHGESVTPEHHPSRRAGARLLRRLAVVAPDPELVCRAVPASTMQHPG